MRNLSLPDRLAALDRHFSGTIGVCAERLDTGDRVAYRADDVFPAASLIKLPVLVEAFRQLAAGALGRDEWIELRTEDKVIGSGILKDLSSRLRLKLADLLLLMMTISDNTATNLVIDRVGVDCVNRTMAELGLRATRLTGKILVDQTRGTDTPAGKGELSPTTPADLVRLLTLVERRACLGADACDRLLDILKRVETDSLIARGLPQDLLHPREGEPVVVLAHKTGSIRGVRNNAALIYTRDFTYAVALLSKGSQDPRRTPDNEGRVVLQEVSGLVYRHFAGAPV